MQSYVSRHYQLPVEKVTLMLPSFLDVLRNHLNDLENVLADEDPLPLGRVGHTLKGALLNMGLADLAEIAADIEVEGKAGNQNFNYAGLVRKLREGLSEIL